jgi:hypothetical protein
MKKVELSSKTITSSLRPKINGNLNAYYIGKNDSVIVIFTKRLVKYYLFMKFRKT